MTLAVRRDVTLRQEYTTAALAEQKGRCLYCKAPLAREVATADHKRPQVQGGRTTRENIGAACVGCNVAKGSIPEGKFWRLIEAAKPPVTAGIDIVLIWASRRIWRRTHRACDRIERVAA